MAEARVIWRPQPKQRAFMERPEYEALYGGAAGGGKSDALLCEALRQVHGFPPFPSKQEDAGDFAGALLFEKVWLNFHGKAGTFQLLAIPCGEGAFTGD